MATITYDALRPLLDQFSGEGLVLSCYADLRAHDGFRPEWRGPIKAKASEFEKTYREDSHLRHEVEENLAAIRQALESKALHSHHWVAVFSAARRNFLKVVPLDGPVKTDLVIDRSPYLVPLLQSSLGRREYLAVLTDTHRGRVYSVTPGAARLRAEFDEEVPKKQHATGQTFGYAQATIARHREECIKHYQKDLIREMERLWDSGNFYGLILLGEHEVLEHVRAQLPQRIASRIVREVPEAWYETPTTVEERIETLAAECDAEFDQEVAPGFADRLQKQKGIASGPKDVLEVLQTGRIGPDGHGYLVLGPDPREAAGRCAACRTVTTEVFGPCPKCQARCIPGSLWEEVLLTALQHRIAVHFLKEPKTLEARGGMIAVLPLTGKM